MADGGAAVVDSVRVCVSVCCGDAPFVATRRASQTRLNYLSLRSVCARSPPMTIKLFNCNFVSLAVGSAEGHIVRDMGIFEEHV